MLWMGNNHNNKKKREKTKEKEFNQQSQSRLEGPEGFDVERCCEKERQILWRRRRGRVESLLWKQQCARCLDLLFYNFLNSLDSEQRSCLVVFVALRFVVVSLFRERHELKPRRCGQVETSRTLLASFLLISTKCESYTRRFWFPALVSSARYILCYIQCFMDSYRSYLPWWQKTHDARPSRRPWELALCSREECG